MIVIASRVLFYACLALSVCGQAGIVICINDDESSGCIRNTIL